MDEKKNGNEDQNATQASVHSGGDHERLDVFDAELREWSFQLVRNATITLGRVFADRKKRWPDGFAIATSAVLHDGSREEGGIVRTLNSRYVLSGPPGDAAVMRSLAQQQLANAWRRQLVENDEELFDLLPAAWGMDDSTFEQIAELPNGWLEQWRNHYRAPVDEDLERIRKLMSFHRALRLVTYGQPDYPRWWHRRWKEGSLIGARTPLEVILAEPAMLDRLAQYFRAQF